MIVCCEALFSDSHQTHTLTITGAAYDKTLTAYLRDGGSDHCHLTLMTKIKIDPAYVGGVRFIWDGYHIERIFAVWLGRDY